MPNAIGLRYVVIVAIQPAEPSSVNGYSMTIPATIRFPDLRSPSTKSRDSADNRTYIESPIKRAKKT